VGAAALIHIYSAIAILLAGVTPLMLAMKSKLKREGQLKKVEKGWNLHSVYCACYTSVHEYLLRCYAYTRVAHSVRFTEVICNMQS